MYRIVAQSFPNNEVRVTWSALPHPKPYVEEKPLTEVCDNEACPPVNSASELNPSPPLSLVSYSQSEPSPAGFGSLPAKPTTFGLNGKRSLIRQGAAMEHEAPPEECLFLTGTLPGSTTDSFRAIAEWSGYIVHRLKSWIGTYAPGKYDFYCWEYQKRGALHLHYCVWIPSDLHRAMVMGKFHAWWVEILHRVGNSANTDLFRKNASHTWATQPDKVRAVAEVCRKSPARYLAKYLSKSAAPKRGSARAFTPSRWWGTSRPLKALCDRLTEKVEIVVGGFHKIRAVWEDVTHACASSDSVTYSYRHKVGSGHTLVSYPNTPEEKSWLLENLRSFTPMAIINSQEQLQTPFQILKTVKIAQLRWLEQSLASLPKKQTGLEAALTTHLNWIRTLIPSTSTEPLARCLAWMARTADLAYICQSCPVFPWGTKKVFDDWLDTMDTQLNRLASMDLAPPK